MSASTESAVEPLISAAKFTEQQALDWLTDNPGHGKTIREIAEIWGWSRSTTQRFLSHKTDVGQDAKSDETGGTSGTAAQPVDDGPPIARAPYADDFKWEPENGAVIVPQQQALAVYVNPWGQVVIRAAEANEGEDAFIVVSPEHLPALIAKLSAILKE